MTANIFGPGHYANTGETATRPTPVVTGKAFRAWFAQCDVNGDGGTNIDDQFLNALLAELRGLVDTAGARADNEISEQMLSEAAARYASGAIFCQDSGTANAYVLSSGLNFVLPRAYFHGMRIIFRPTTAPTGAATVNVNSIGPKALLSADGTPLTGVEFEAQSLLDAFYDSGAASGAGGFRLAPWVNPISAGANVAPIYPEVLSDNNTMSVTATTGSATINASQSWVHRGSREFSTNSFASGQRTFQTSPNKTYHLRWYPPGHPNAPAGTWPNGRFMLRDLADTAIYNPGALPEYDASFDTTYDDMLIARIATNGANALTVTPLRNMAILKFSAIDTASTFGYVSTGALAAVSPSSSARILFQYGIDQSGYCASQFTLNWSRRPSLASVNAGVGVEQSATGNGAMEGRANYVHSRSVNRYTALFKYSTDWAVSPAFIMQSGSGKVVLADAWCELNALA